MHEPGYPAPAPLDVIDLVVLQGTPFCNLNCSYCYLSEASRRVKASLPVSAIRHVFSKVFASRFIGSTLQISWHSGEPLILGPAYYDDAIQAIVDAKAECGSPNVKLRFDIQTNGTLIDATWCALFRARRESLTVGVSCDGPAYLHDACRRNWAGKPTHSQVVRAMDMLVENDLQFDVIAVLSSQSLDEPAEFLEFFTPYAGSIREFHFNLSDEFPIATGDVEARDAFARKYRSFLDSLLELMRGEGRLAPLVRVRNFADFYGRLLAASEGAAMADARRTSRPFGSLTIDVKGNVATFYAGLTGDDYKELYGDGQGLVIGNLLHQDLDEIAASPKLRRIADDFEVSHRACETRCEYWSLCPGGYNLIKHKRYGTFNAAETPECVIHVKTFADTLLADIGRFARERTAGRGC